MLSRYIIIPFITILNALSSEGKDDKLPLCEKPILDPDFANLYTYVVNNIWTVSALNAPANENFVWYPWHVLRLLGVIMGGARGATRQQYENKASWDKWTEGHIRYLDCLKTHGYDDIFIMKELGYFGYNVMPWLRPDYVLKIYQTFKIDFHHFRPLEQKSDIKKLLIKEGLKMTNKTIVNIFQNVFETGMDEAYIFGGHLSTISWKNPFDVSATKAGTFIVNPKENVTVPMMTMEKVFPRSAENYRGKKFDWVELPFEEQRLSMIIIAPRNNSNVNKTILAMKNNMLHSIMKERSNKNRVTLNFPKFTIPAGANNIEESLKDKMVRLDKIVSYEADLLNMSSSPSYLKSIRQEFFYYMDEVHIRSAAIVNFLLPNIGGDLIPTISRKEDPKVKLEDMPIFEDPEDFIDEQYHRKKSFTINCTTPFIFAIVDKVARIPWIMGRIVKP